MSVITRFAPSPTGYLHIGGVRTALFSWLYARQQQGQFILRVEDTDQERSTQASVDAILEGMKWLKLDWDQGPFYQTERMDRYQAIASKLLNEGKAYRCTCSKERLETLREAQMAKGVKPKYDGRCRELNLPDSINEPYVVRLKAPSEGSVKWRDLIKGDINVPNEELDDFILVRSEGMPTYNFSVAIDDWDMGITHVLRGDDHVSNTPKQINLLNALGAPLPEYGHVPMILGEDGKRLSKRHGAVSVLEYRDQGYLPEAVLNFLVRLGWSCGDEEIFSVEDMIAKFDFAHVSRSPAALNTKKLNWLNQHYIKTLPVEHVVEQLLPFCRELGLDLAAGPDVAELIPLYGDRCQTLRELAEQVVYFYQDIADYDEKAAKKHLRPVAMEPLQALYDELKQLADWQPVSIQNAVNSVAEKLDVGMGKVGMPLRVAMTGAGNSPGVDQVAFYLGQDNVLKRLERAMAFVRARAED